MSELDEATLRKLSRTEMIRVLREFMSERDAAKQSAMRAFDERNLALADTRRFEWFFGPTDKSLHIPNYIRGAAEGWTVNQWRAWCDKAIAEQVSA
jgi:hypothetical protein